MSRTYKGYTIVTSSLPVKIYRPASQEVFATAESFNEAKYKISEDILNQTIERNIELCLKTGIPFTIPFYVSKAKIKIPVKYLTKVSCTYLSINHSLISKRDS